MASLITLIFLAQISWGDGCGLPTACKKFLQEKKQTIPDRMSGEMKLLGGRAPTTSAEFLKRLNRIHDEVKSRITKVFLKGRAESQLTPEEQKVIQLMSKATLKECDRSYSTGCPAARAMAGEGQVCFCREMEQTSDEDWIFTMGHELAHLADLCRPETTGIKSGAHPHEVLGPGGSSIQCLDLNGVRGATQRSPEMKPSSPIFKFLNDKVHSLPTETFNANHHAPCSHFWKNPNEEGRADLVGFEILGDFLKEHPLDKNDPDKFYRVFGSMMKGCDDPSPKLGMADSHAPDYDRITKIGFSISSIREAMGCQDHTTNFTCDYHPSVSEHPLSRDAPATR